MNDKISVYDISKSDIQDTSYDLAIFACGYEQRCTYLFSNLNEKNFKSTLVLGFMDKVDSSESKENEAFYAERNISAKIVEQDTEKYINQILKEYTDSFSDSNNSIIKILVDYSSMPRGWYAAIINFYKFFKLNKKIELHFSYSIGEHNQDDCIRQISMPQCLPGCESHYAFSKKRICIFSLGFEGEATSMLLDKLEPDETFAFLASPGALPNYAERAKNKNSLFLREAIGENNSNLFYSSLFSVQDTFYELLEIILPYKTTANIALIPFGPKPHVLASILVAINLGHVSCLYSKLSGRSSSSVPTGELVLCSVTFD